MISFVSADGEVAVDLEPQAVEQMLRQAARGKRKETGGILTGRYSALGDRAFVQEASGPPPDSKREAAAFFRGVAGLTRRLRRLWDHGSYYIGEWHFHPFASASPSPRDLQQMLAFAADPDYRCPRPILVVVGGDPSADWLIEVRLIADRKVITLRRLTGGETTDHDSRASDSSPNDPAPGPSAIGGAYLRMIPSLARIGIPLSALLSVLSFFSMLLFSVVRTGEVIVAIPFALMTVVPGFITLSVMFTMLLLCIVVAGDVVRWMIDRTPPRLTLELDDDPEDSVGFTRYLRAFFAYYMTGEYRPDLDMRGGLSAASWPRLCVMFSIMLAGCYAAGMFAASALAILLVRLAAQPDRLLGTLPQEALDAVGGWYVVLAGAYLMMSLGFVLFTLIGIVAVPRRRSSEHQLAILTYMCLGTFWFALLYQSGSVSGLLRFAIAGPDGERVGALSFLDAAYFALGTSVTAGSGGITPADGPTRAVVLLQFVLLGLVIYWLFQRRSPAVESAYRPEGH